MNIRNRTDKAPKGQQTTGRGETPVKTGDNISPDGATDSSGHSATPSGLALGVPVLSRGSCVPSVASVSFVAERRFAPHPACGLGSPSRLLRQRSPSPRRQWRTPRNRVRSHRWRWRTMRKSRRASGMTLAPCETMFRVLAGGSATRETMFGVLVGTSAVRETMFGDLVGSSASN